MRSTNREYLAVLSRLAEFIRREYHVEGLPDLTADQLFRWLQMIDPDDLAQVVSELDGKALRLHILDTSEKARSADEKELRAA